MAVARVRSWQAVLSVAELNAERLSMTAVKAGALFDAPFDSRAALGGFTQNGLFTNGPMVGVGQLTVNGSNYLSRVTNLPTFNTMTICGYFCYWLTPTAATDETIMSVAYNGGSSHTWFGVNSSDVALGWDTTGGYSGNVLTMTKGAWYFYAYQVNGTAVSLRIVPAQSPIQGSTVGAITVPAAQTTTALHSLQSNTLSSPATGFTSRIRAWNSILSDAELNAEQASSIAVKAGSLFDAPLTTTSDLGGFTIAGSLTTGP
jgi:hypothetical protein